MAKEYLGNVLQTRIQYNEVIENNYQIVVAELPNTVIELYQNSTLLQTKTTDSIKGGRVIFNVTNNGEYTIKAKKDNVEIWTNTVTLTDIGVYKVKSGKALTNYTMAELHLIQQAGAFSTMFDYDDKWKLIDSTSIFNNKEFFPMSINTMDDGREEVEWCMAGNTSSSYSINPRIVYLNNAEATSWTSDYLNTGGFKYCQLRRECMQQGEDIYSQFTSIKPDDSTVEGGIKFSELKYTKSNETSAIYEYNYQTDTFTVVSAYGYGSHSTWFTKGYFKNVGQIGETTFNSGNYYTYDSSKYLYSTATTYDSSTTYYGFYKTLQEDGSFVTALNSINQYLKKWDDKASTGSSNNYSYLSSFSDYVHIPCIEEITDLNRNKYLFSGNSAQSANVYNIAGEGEKKVGFNSFAKQATGSWYWTRSSYSTSDDIFCCISGHGYISGNGVYSSNNVRVCFQTL